ncbi:DUF3106 domain-containing protein [Arenimonas fontis]|uniref:DUF3106 domain-containing protein n=1 Tax=Arenimonas fontis TaxID=2608255 RepID=A0A5B2Z8F8_9GAMM|nr:DUF3106 domain-containing protein [Arenimonas fontis]KAA2284177.1 DUF3106 domain-containing protein [Arenimonas fontis]
MSLASAKTYALPALILASFLLPAMPVLARPPEEPAPPPARQETAADPGPRLAPEHRPPHRDRWLARLMRMGPVPVPGGVVVPRWTELDPDRQARLARFEQRWDQMPASARVHLLERLERHQRWEAMSPEERERIRAGVRHFLDMPPELQEKARASFQALRALPPEQRRDLLQRWRSLSPEQRRAWLEAGGPAIAPAPDAPADTDRTGGPDGSG